MSNTPKCLLTWGGLRFQVQKATENEAPNKELDMVVCDSSFHVIDLVTDENNIDAQSNASAARPLSPDLWWKIIKKFYL